MHFILIKIQFLSSLMVVEFCFNVILLFFSINKFDGQYVVHGIEVGRVQSGFCITKSPLKYPIFL